MKKLLCIVSRPPYRDTHSLELIETAMVGAVFDFRVSVLFRDDGVWSLLKNQDAGPLAQRTLANVLQALPTYEIEDVYVCAPSLEARGLDAKQLVLAAKALAPAEQTDLIADQDVVMGAQA